MQEFFYRILYTNPAKFVFQTGHQKCHFPCKLRISDRRAPVWNTGFFFSSVQYIYDSYEIPIPNWPSRMPFCVTSNSKKDKSYSASQGKIEKGQAAKPRGNLNQLNCWTIV